MNESISIRCGPIDRTGKRLVIAVLGSAEYRDRFDTDDAYRRSKFRERVVERFGLADDAHDWLKQRILAAADAEDERDEGELLSASQPVLVTMSDVKARSIDWLWPQRIAAGRLTLLVGRPGCGKSFLTCDMASRVSTGTPWPDAGEGTERGSQGRWSFASHPGTRQGEAGRCGLPRAFWRAVDLEASRGSRPQRFRQSPPTSHRVRQCWVLESPLARL